MRIRRGRLVPGLTRSSALALQLCLVGVSPATDQFTAAPLEIAEDLVVGVFVLLENLERPSPRQHVAADELPFKVVGQVGMPGPAQHVDGITEGEVGRSGQLVKRVQVPAGDLDRLECFGQPANRLDGGPTGFARCHAEDIPGRRQRHAERGGRV